LHRDVSPSIRVLVRKEGADEVGETEAAAAEAAPGAESAAPDAVVAEVPSESSAETQE